MVGLFLVGIGVASVGISIGARTSDITLMSFERYGVSIHRRLVCFFSSLFWLTTNKIPKLRITCPL